MASTFILSFSARGASMTIPQGLKDRENMYWGVCDCGLQMESESTASFFSFFSFFLNYSLSQLQ